MKTIGMYVTSLVILVLTACGSSSTNSIPFSTTLPSTTDNYSILWVGSGLSYVYKDGQYVRSASNDYAFEVVQRRYGNSWKSIKNMHRIHPDYDGRAGAREQTLFFAIDFSKKEDQLVSTIYSSLGNGKGTSDEEFRAQVLQLALTDISAFAPYNTMRITQDYQYEKGRLQETVELFKRTDDGKEIPFAKIEETAKIFRPTLLEKAPTVFQ